MVLRELLEKTEICVFAANMDIEVHGVSYDTRTLRAGEIFVAVTGFEFDGYQYVE